MRTELDIRNEVEDVKISALGDLSRTIGGQALIDYLKTHVARCELVFREADDLEAFRQAQVICNLCEDILSVLEPPEPMDEEEVM